MIAALLGPSGSDRRFYSLVALTLLLSPLGMLAVRWALPDASLRDVALIGPLGVAVVVWAGVVCYGVGRMAVHGLSELGQADSQAATQADGEPLAA